MSWVTEILLISCCQPQAKWPLAFIMIEWQCHRGEGAKAHCTCPAVLFKETFPFSSKHAYRELAFCSLVAVYMVLTSKTRFFFPLFCFVFYLVVIKSVALLVLPYLGILGNAATYL